MLAELGPQLSARSPTKLATNAFEISPDNLSLHTLRDQLLSKADRSNQRRLFGENASPAKRRRSSMSRLAGEGELDINWPVYKEWPEGLIEEERLLLVSASREQTRSPTGDPASRTNILVRIPSISH